MSCGASGKASYQRQWSILVAIILMFFGFLPGIVYLVISITMRKRVPICQTCKRSTLVPAGSPQGIRITETFSKMTKSPIS